MKEFTFYNRHSDVTLSIQQDLIDDINEQTVNHFPDEFGGFLFGNYLKNSNHLQIFKHSVPDIFKSTAMGFERYTDGMTEFKKTYEFGTEPHYVGEWHSHPGGFSMYSQADLSAMQRIEAFETVTIRNPVLLIVSTNIHKEINYKFYLYHNGGLTAYEQN